MPFASVLKDTLEIHSLVVHQDQLNPSKKNLLIPAHHHLADLTLTVLGEMATLPDVLAKLATLAFHPTADPNVLSILTAQVTWLVFKKSARTHAQELALPLPDVKSFLIDPLVLVHQVQEVTLMSQDVPKYLPISMKI